MPAGDLKTPEREVPETGSIAAGGRAASRKREILLFLILAVLIWPFIAVGIVGAWGFLVWMSQLVTGPPGPLL